MSSPREEEEISSDEESLRDSALRDDDDEEIEDDKQKLQTLLNVVGIISTTNSPDFLKAQYKQILEEEKKDFEKKIHIERQKVQHLQKENDAIREGTQYLQSFTVTYRV